MAQKSLDLVWDNIARTKGKDHQDRNLSHSDIIIQSLEKLSKMQGETFIIKLPCEIINSHERLSKFAKDVALLRSLDISVIIVHEYNDIMPEILEFFNVKEKFASISTVMDYKSMHIVEMLVSGYINKKITSAINTAGAQAVGISGKDCNMIMAKKYNVAAKRNAKDNGQIIDMGFIGEPALVNPEILIDMDGCNIVTVLSPVASGIDGESFLLDPNLTSAIISSALSASRLFFLSNKGGLRKNGNLINEMTLEELREIKNSGELNHEGYIDIIDSAISAIENYTENVHIIDSNIDHSILLHLFSEDKNIGTLISMLSDEHNERN